MNKSITVFIFFLLLKTGIDSVKFLVLLLIFSWLKKKWRANYTPQKIFFLRISRKKGC